MIRALNKSAIDETQRILIRLLPLKDASIHTVDTQALKLDKNSAYLLPVSQEENSLGHTYSNLNLGRWWLPIARKPEAGPIEDPNQPENTVKTLEKAAKMARRLISRTLATMKGRKEDSSKVTKEVGRWEPNFEYSFSAELGHVLSSLELAQANKAEPVHSLSSQLSFLPSSLSLPSLFLSPDVAMKGKRRSILTYDFTPDPIESKLKSDEMFPTLRIQIRTHQNGNRPQFHKLELSFQQRIHDVHLPNKVVDIRFSQFARLALKKDHNDSNVQEWINAVITNIESGDRLNAPSLRIEIPKWTISRYDSDEKGVHAVTYLFTGVQFRQKTTADFQGTHVIFSAVQSDKLNANGGELQAYYSADKEERDTLLQDKEQLEKFVTTCFRLADTITERASQTLPMSKMLAPRNEHSERKTRRLSEQAAALENAENAKTEDESIVDDKIQSPTENTHIDPMHEMMPGMMPVDNMSEEHSFHSNIQDTAVGSPKNPHLSSILTPMEPEVPFPKRVSGSKSEKAYDSQTAMEDEHQPLKSAT